MSELEKLREMVLFEMSNAVKLDDPFKSWTGVQGTIGLRRINLILGVKIWK